MLFMRATLLFGLNKISSNYRLEIRTQVQFGCKSTDRTIIDSRRRRRLRRPLLRKICLIIWRNLRITHLLTKKLAAIQCIIVLRNQREGAKNCAHCKFVSSTSGSSSSSSSFAPWAIVNNLQLINYCYYMLKSLVEGSSLCVYATK